MIRMLAVNLANGLTRLTFWHTVERARVAIVADSYAVPNSAANSLARRIATSGCLSLLLCVKSCGRGRWQSYGHKLPSLTHTKKSDA